jgi:uncharacterized integral membrane protein
MKWQWLIILVLLLILVIFSVQNYGVVKIQFLFWSFRTSRAIMFFVTLMLGVIIGWITAFLFRSK